MRAEHSLHANLTESRVKEWEEVHVKGEIVFQVNRSKRMILNLRKLEKAQYQKYITLIENKVLHTLLLLLLMGNGMIWFFGMNCWMKFVHTRLHIFIYSAFWQIKNCSTDISMVDGLKIIPCLRHHGSKNYFVSSSISCIVDRGESSLHHMRCE